ncbi:MAG: hypothetical protein MJK18_03140, partial [Bdellovibrionales bacterium]|nr:hypothetical protein [Bdellovibrionales bacterium]
ASQPTVYGDFVNGGLQRFPYYIYGVPQTSGTRMKRTEYEAVAFINMKKAVTEAEKELYYNAKQVLKNLANKVKKPEKK